MNRYKFLFFFLMVAWCGLHIAAQGPTPKEYQVKAAFLYNFSQFVEWPAASFAAEDAPFIIGILGNDPFGSYIDEVVSDEKVLGHPIIIHRYKDAEDVEDCHILFVGSAYLKELPGISRKNMLTVGEANNFAGLGGVIGFFTENGKIRFNVNVTAARLANLNISSKLLRVAKVTNK